MAGAFMICGIAIELIWLAIALERQHRRQVAAFLARMERLNQAMDECSYACEHRNDDPFLHPHKRK